MEKRIKQSDVWDVMQTKDERGRYKMFSFSYVRLNESREGNGRPGSIEHYEAAVFSSIYAKGSTVNIRIKGERFPRKFVRCMIIRINGKKIYA
ncbi:hypothetical protein [Parabacteroides goldsteinii]|jgi:hypothetical protein|uniref:Uncharacterized protein n=1 Tax=Parabacteroides goldsteinii CL02T12C30 TaxID=999418 RepID=K5YMH4_9BACT|nr:hypothetical protein [Parabacteroides goldsteinii]EKN15057.1 hypothetical protein HMPREF1076_02394 [Parabacteroides goldsteinii CL02T12C30]DAJ14004.1 MAG TPA: hypothetical protein [Siphoviridae sp. ctqkP4]